MLFQRGVFYTTSLNQRQLYFFANIYSVGERVSFYENSHSEKDNNSKMIVKVNFYNRQLKYFRLFINQLVNTLHQNFVAQTRIQQACLFLSELEIVYEFVSSCFYI